MGENREHRMKSSIPRALQALPPALPENQNAVGASLKQCYLCHRDRLWVKCPCSLMPTSRTSDVSVGNDTPPSPTSVPSGSAPALALVTLGPDYPQWQGCSCTVCPLSPPARRWQQAHPPPPQGVRTKNVSRHCEMPPVDAKSPG